MSLIDKIKKARESNVEIDGITFTIRRPTDHEALHDILKINPKDKSLVLKVSTKYMLEHFVVDWKDMQECNLIPGGNPEPVPFSSEVFLAWAEDHLSVWPILSKAIVESYLSYKDAKDVSLGKQEPG